MTILNKELFSSQHFVFDIHTSKFHIYSPIRLFNVLRMKSFFFVKLLYCIFNGNLIHLIRILFILVTFNLFCLYLCPCDEMNLMRVVGDGFS